MQPIKLTALKSREKDLNLIMKALDAIKMIDEDGWFLVRQKGDHKQYKHPVKRGPVTIAVHMQNDEIARGSLSSIFKQAQIDKK